MSNRDSPDQPIATGHSGETPVQLVIITLSFKAFSNILMCDPHPSSGIFLGFSAPYPTALAQLSCRHYNKQDATYISGTLSELKVYVIERKKLAGPGGTGL